MTTICLPQVSGVGFRELRRHLARGGADVEISGFEDQRVGAGGLLVWKELDLLWLG